MGVIGRKTLSCVKILLSRCQTLPTTMMLVISRWLEMVVTILCLLLSPVIAVGISRALGGTVRLLLVPRLPTPSLVILAPQTRVLPKTRVVPSLLQPSTVFLLLLSLLLINPVNLALVVYLPVIIITTPSTLPITPSMVMSITRN